jgi:hypothetical protein
MPENRNSRAVERRDDYCASNVTKLIKFRPYRVRVVNDLTPVYTPQRIWFCNWMLQNVHDWLIDLQLLFITDEAYFHWSGYVNSQNTWIWSDEKPHAVHPIPLHYIKIGVWCAVSARWIIRPMSYHETVNSDRYVRNILEPFFEQLTDDERQYGYFQQDNATAHIARNSMSALQEVFDDRIITTRLWPPRSPDLSVCDFYLWGSLKGNVYRNALALLKLIKMR